jgi:hypothetical protein
MKCELETGLVSWHRRAPAEVGRRGQRKLIVNDVNYRVPYEIPANNVAECILRSTTAARGAQWCRGKTRREQFAQPIQYLSTASASRSATLTWSPYCRGAHRRQQRPWRRDAFVFLRRAGLCVQGAGILGCGAASYRKSLKLRPDSEEVVTHPSRRAQRSSVKRLFESRQFKRYVYVADHFGGASPCLFRLRERVNSARSVSD